MPMVKITEADLRPEDAELIVLAVNTLKRLLSEEGQEVMARAILAKVPIGRMTKAEAGQYALAAISAILGNQP